VGWSACCGGTIGDEELTDSYALAIRPRGLLISLEIGFQLVNKRWETGRHGWV
jgi:hypothetical protein